MASQTEMSNRGDDKANTSFRGCVLSSDGAPWLYEQFYPFFSWTSNDATTRNSGYLVSQYLWINQSRGVLSGKPDGSY